MTVSYPAPLTYNQAGYQQPVPKKKSCAGGAIAGATLGAVTGGVIAAKTNPHISKSGEVVEEFAQRAYQNFVDGGTDLAKKVHQQGVDIINNIKKVKNPDELRDLFNTNKEAVENYCKSVGQTIDEFLSTVTERNLKDNKEAVKNWFNTEAKTKLNSMKNWIQASYDATEKKFAKVPEVAQEAFEAIEKAANSGNGGRIAKTAAVVGVVGAIAGWCIHNLARAIKEGNAQH